MERFEIGKTYESRSICDWNCVTTFTVTKRTSQFITIDGDSLDEPKRVKIKERSGGEFAYVDGVYSMAPTISAGRLAA